MLLAYYRGSGREAGKFKFYYTTTLQEILSLFYIQCSWHFENLTHLTNTQLVSDRAGIQSQTCLMPKTCAPSLYHFNKLQKALLSDLLDQDGRDSDLDPFSTWYFCVEGVLIMGKIGTQPGRARESLEAELSLEPQASCFLSLKENSFSCPRDLI